MALETHRERIEPASQGPRVFAWPIEGMVPGWASEMSHAVERVGHGCIHARMDAASINSVRSNAPRLKDLRGLGLEDLERLVQLLVFRSLCRFRLGICRLAGQRLGLTCNLRRRLIG